MFSKNVSVCPTDVRYKVKLLLFQGWTTVVPKATVPVSRLSVSIDFHFNNNNNDDEFISIALFHVKHAQLR